MRTWTSWDSPALQSGADSKENSPEVIERMRGEPTHFPGCGAGTYLNIQTPVPAPSFDV